MFLIETLDALHTLSQQLLAESSPKNEQAVLFHGDQSFQVASVNVVVSPKGNVSYRVLLPFVDLIHQQNLSVLLLEIGMHLNVEITLLLKVVR